MIDVSFIIVNWNTKDLLLECIESIRAARKNLNIEIIVVDNASSDGSPEAVRNLSDHINIIVNNNNIGFSKANNIGMRRSHGRYMCVVNSDIKVLNYCIEDAIGYMDNNHSIGVLGPQVLNRQMKIQYTCREYPNLWSTFCQAFGFHRFFEKSKLFKDSFMTYFDHTSIRKVDVLSGCFLIVRKEAIQQVGFFDERFFIYGEDVDWCRRFNEAGWDVIFYPLSHVIHYGGTSSASAPARFNIEMLKAHFQYWEKWHGNPSNALYIILRLFSVYFRVVILSCILPFKHSMKRDLIGVIKKHAAMGKWILKNKVLCFCC